MRAARHAGPAIDSAAVMASTTVTSANVVGSSGRTPKSSVSIRRPLIAASTSPMAAPVPTTRMAFVSTSRRTSWVVAPSARRTPIDLSLSTVETHRANLMQKLNLHNTAEVVLYAVRKGIIV
jgi:Bacterial regulatory proteins, luxR family